MIVFDHAAFEANLTAAAGDDAELLDELRAAFIASVSVQADLLKRARCDGNWTVAAMRLKGLGSSFHSAELIDLAQIALDSAPGEPTAIRSFETFLTVLKRSSEPSGQLL